MLSLVPKKSSELLGLMFGGKREEVVKLFFCLFCFYCWRELNVVTLPI